MSHIINFANSDQSARLVLQLIVSPSAVKKIKFEQLAAADNSSGTVHQSCVGLVVGVGLALPTVIHYIVTGIILLYFIVKVLFLESLHNIVG